MKKLVLLLCLAWPLGVIAQNHQTDTVETKSIIPMDKQGLLKDVDMIVNGKFSANYQGQGAYHDFKSLRMDQLRLEIMGDISPKLYFRMRMRFTPVPLDIPTDNVDNRLDVAFITMKASDKWSFTAGRYFSDYGGYENDANSIHLYQATDIVSYMDSYLVGVATNYHLKNHTLEFLVMNPRNDSFEKTYSAFTRDLDEGMTGSKTPFLAALNWRGKLLPNEALETISSYTIIGEHAGEYTNTAIVGLQSKPTKRTQIQLDGAYTFEQLDNKRIVSDLITNGTDGRTPGNSIDDQVMANNAYQRIAHNIEYYSIRTRLDYRLSERFNLFFEGFAERWNWNDAAQLFPGASKKIRMGYGYTPGIEILPLRKQPVTIYLAYMGHNYEYSDFSRNTLGLHNQTKGIITLGLYTRFAVM